MTSLKQKLSALKAWIASKFLQASKFFAANFLACIAAILAPVLVIFACLFYQTHKVEEIISQPNLKPKVVRALEKKAAKAQQSAVAWKGKADSLTSLVAHQDKLISKAQIKADSLHKNYESISPTWTPTTLQSYLANYKPSPDSL